MLWKIIIPAIDAGYDDLAEILMVTSFVLMLAADLHDGYV